MASSTLGKKRKRQEEDNTEATGLRFSVSGDSRVSGSHPVPVLALRAALETPKDTPFTAYVSEAEPHVVRLHADDGKMEWSSQAEESGLAGFSYYIAVHHKSTGEVSLLPAPPHIMTPSVKAYRDLPERGGADEEVLDYRERRDMLGTTFGTRRAQRQIAQNQRNKIDPTTEDMVKQIDSIVKSVSESNVHYPTAEEQQKLHDDTRPIPPFNREATTPKEVYDVEAVAPQIELDALNILEYFNVKADMQRIYLLPHQKSKFVKERLFKAVADVKDKENISRKQRKRLQWITYLSVLMAFRVGKHSTKNGPRSRLDGKQLAPIIVTSVADRFTEKMRGGAATVTDRSEKLLLHYILVLALMIDNFSIDIAVISDDLNLSTKVIETALKGLGCRTAFPTEKEYEQLTIQAKAQGVTISDQRNAKRAVLTVPLTFPAPPKKKAKAAKH